MMMDTLGNTAESMRQFEEALRLQGNIPEAAYTHNSLGQILGKRGRMDEAARQFEEALRLNPLLYDVRINYGSALVACGRSQEAVEVFQEALRLKPATPTRGKGLKWRSRDREAAATPRKTCARPCGQLPMTTGPLQTRPGPGNSWRAAGGGKRIPAGRSSEARFRHGAQQPGLLLGKQGRLDEAIAEFHVALRLNPKLADTECNLAVALSMHGRQNDAIAALRKAVKIMPGHTKAHENLAIMHFQRQEYAKAWQEVSLCGSTVEIRRHHSCVICPPRCPSLRRAIAPQTDSHLL